MSADAIEALRKVFDSQQGSYLYTRGYLNDRDLELMLATAGPILRADERAKTSTAIANAIQADSDNDDSETPDWYAGMNHAAGIAREYATGRPESHAAGREGTPASDSVQDNPKPAETLSGHSGTQEAQG